MGTHTLANRTLSLSHDVDRLISAFARHWLLAVNVLSGLFVGLTIAAPLLMAMGLERPARLLYAAYALNCHQLPQRSYFLFGPHGIDTYSLEQVLAWGADPDHLRAFVGNAEVGFKMAMAHRTTAIFGTMSVTGLVYALFRRRVSSLSWKWVPILVAPMLVDGLSHVINEITGLGFRNTNAWAVWLTGNTLAPAFYTGTTVGSLNWMLRTFTGALVGLATVWLLYPLLNEEFADQ